MRKSYLAVLSSLAFSGAVIANAPYAWSQAGQPGTGAAPSAGQKSGSESRMDKPTDPAVGSGRTGSSESGVSRREGSGMQGDTASRSGKQWSKDQVKEIQEALKTKGFDPGAADGVIGPKTNQALREFQKSNNLQVTGRIDDKTASALGVQAGGSSTSSMGGSSAPSSSSARGSSSSSSVGKETTGRQQESGKPEGSTEEKTGSNEPAKSGARGGTSSSPSSKSIDK